MNDASSTLSPNSPADVQKAFADVTVWIFDLDNTLYPPESALWPQVDERITLYLGDLFGIDGISARALQKYYYRRYGTTLKGLMDEYDVPPKEFLDFAHQIDLSLLAPDPDLGDAIAALKVQCHTGPDARDQKNPCIPGPFKSGTSLGGN